MKDVIVQALIQFFVELSLLRRAPQDLPASDLLLILVGIVGSVIGVVIGLVARLSLAASVVQTLAEILLMLGALGGALHLMGIPARFTQSATALLGSGAVIGAIALIPLGLNPTGTDETDLAALGALMLLAVFVWSVLVTGHILRHTFRITLGQGAAIAVIFKIVSVFLIGIVVGGG